MNTRTLCLVAAALWASMAYPNTAVACSPLEVSVAEIVADADFVVRGRIIQLTLIRGDDYEGVRMTVEAYSYWKDPSGEFASIVDIYTPTIAGCGLPARVGDITTFTGWTNVLGWSTADFYSWRVDPIYPPGLDDILGPPLRVSTNVSTMSTLKQRY